MNRLLNYNLFFLFLCAYLFSKSSTRPSGTGISSDPYLIGTLSGFYIDTSTLNLTLKAYTFIALTILILRKN